MTEPISLNVNLQYYLKTAVIHSRGFLLASMSLLRISSKWVYRHFKVWISFVSPQLKEIELTTRPNDVKHQVCHTLKFPRWPVSTFTCSQCALTSHLQCVISSEIELKSWMPASWCNSVWVAIMRKGHAVKHWYSAVMGEGRKVSEQATFLSIMTRAGRCTVAIWVAIMSKGRRVIRHWWRIAMKDKRGGWEHFFFQLLIRAPWCTATAWMAIMCMVKH